MPNISTEPIKLRQQSLTAKGYFRVYQSADLPDSILALGSIFPAKKVHDAVSLSQTTN